MQRQYNTPKASSVVPAKKTNSNNLYISHDTSQTKNGRDGTKSKDNKSSAFLKQVDSKRKSVSNQTINSHTKYTNKSLYDRLERQKKRNKDPKLADSWRRGKSVHGLRLGVAPGKGTLNTLERRNQRIKARKLERSQSTESNKSGDTLDTVQQDPTKSTVTRVDDKNVEKTKKPILAPKVDAPSTVKPRNAWDTPLKLVQSDVKEASVVPTINSATTKNDKPIASAVSTQEDKSPHREEDQVDAPKYESQLDGQQTAMVPRLRTVYTPSSTVASLPTEVVVHVSPAPQPFPRNAYPRVTPLPIHTYPIANASLPPKEIYNSLSAWQVSPNHVIAMDCEMVGVREGGKHSMLARVSLVDWNGTVLMDTYVAPTEHVTDYRTFVSGIHPHHLISPNAMDFHACRMVVHRWLQERPILVGHALINDLAALRINHPWFLIRDSATYLPFTKPCCRGACPKRLRDLAKEELGISIQADGGPHCPIVDARTAMELYKRKQIQWDLYVQAHRNYALTCLPLALPPTGRAQSK